MKESMFFTLILAAALMVGCATSQADASALRLQMNTGIDPDSWALVSEGEFLTGQFEELSLIDYDYEMMVTQVTNGQYAGYLNTALEAGHIHMEEDGVFGFYPGDEFHGYKHEEEIEAGDYLHVPLGDSQLRLVVEDGLFAPQPEYEDHPVVMVTWFGARAYCEYYGWRLPTELEWEKAARGVKGGPYPWGEEISGANANYYASGDPCEWGVGKHGGTTPVGFFNGKQYGGFQTIDSPSPYGLYDMAGNVWEWTGDVYRDQHYRFLRGGSNADYDYNLRVWTRNSAGPDYFSPNAGFRCARDAE